MHIIEYPALPMESPIYEGMNHDAKIDIHGDPHEGPHNGFVVELPSYDGIAFHMSVRMGYGGENVIVLNNFRNGCWGPEERHHNIFHMHHHFHLKIKNHHSHYAIHVNGHHVCKFHHREDPHRVRALAVRGDVKVEKIHFEHFKGHNGGGVQIGSSYPQQVVMAPPPPQVVVAAPNPPPVIIAPAPRPTVVIEPILRPRPVVVIETGRHHHHHGIFGHRHHHHHHHC